MTGSLPKKKIIQVTGLNQWRGKYGYFNKSVYVDCMGKQVVVQTVHTFGPTSQVTILCQLFLQLLLQSMSDCYKHNTPAALLGENSFC